MTFPSLESYFQVPWLSMNFLWPYGPCSVPTTPSRPLINLFANLFTHTSSQHLLFTKVSIKTRYFNSVRIEINPFTPKSDQFQSPPAASSEMLHHTVWKTRLFIAYSDERWLYYQFALLTYTVIFRRLKKVCNLWGINMKWKHPNMNRVRGWLWNVPEMARFFTLL